MSSMKKRGLFWAPRAIGLLFALFLALLALDVFGEGYGPWQTLVALLIHLTPTYIVLAALAIAWRRERLGAALFVGLAVLYIVLAWGRFSPLTYVIVAGPLLLISALFIVVAAYRDRRGTA
ncbi:MAG: hypothetical protein Kow0047_12720 [Anaerolineae bacterium]